MWAAGTIYLLLSLLLAPGGRAAVYKASSPTIIYLKPQDGADCLYICSVAGLDHVPAGAAAGADTLAACAAAGGAKHGALAAGEHGTSSGGCAPAGLAGSFLPGCL